MGTKGRTQFPSLSDYENGEGERREHHEVGAEGQDRNFTLA